MGGGRAFRRPGRIHPRGSPRPGWGSAGALARGHADGVGGVQPGLAAPRRDDDAQPRHQRRFRHPVAGPRRVLVLDHHPAPIGGPQRVLNSLRGDCPRPGQAAPSKQPGLPLFGVWPPWALSPRGIDPGVWEWLRLSRGRKGGQSPDGKGILASRSDGAAGVCGGSGPRMSRLGGQVLATVCLGASLPATIRLASRVQRSWTVRIPSGER